MHNQNKMFNHTFLIVTLWFWVSNSTILSWLAQAGGCRYITSIIFNDNEHTSAIQKIEKIHCNLIV